MKNHLQQIQVNVRAQVQPASVKESSSNGCVKMPPLDINIAARIIQFLGMIKILNTQWLGMYQGIVPVPEVNVLI